MFWVFCCSCFVRPFQAPQRKFFISSCSHIYCERCINHVHPYCRRCCMSIKVIACDSQMPLEVRSIFCDANDKVPGLVKAFEYQTGQRFGLMSHLRSIDQKYTSAKTFIKDSEMKYTAMKQKMESAMRKIKELELANETLKRQVQKIRQTAPLPSPPNETSQWFSHINFPRSVNLRRSSVDDSPSAPFTPKNCYTQFKNPSPLISQSFTPAKTPLISDTPSVRYGISKMTPGYSTPQKNMSILNILNK